MTHEQFYYCLERILELREKIKATYNVRRIAQATESALAEEQQVDFDSLQRFADNKESADRNTAKAQALIKELAAQEVKIREFVPVSAYGVTIEAKLPQQPPLQVVVEAEQIYVKYASRP